MPVWPYLNEYRNRDKKRAHEKEIAEQLKRLSPHVCIIRERTHTLEELSVSPFSVMRPNPSQILNYGPNPTEPDRPTTNSKTVQQLMSITFEHINTIFITIKYKLIPIARNCLTGVQNVLCMSEHASTHTPST